jgi:ribosome-binding factor A
MRRVPELKIKYYNAEAYANEIERILIEIKQKDGSNDKT